MRDIEDIFVSESRRQGFQPGPNAMRQAAIDLAGSVQTAQGLIALPGKGSISPADYARCLRAAMPEAFGSLSSDDRPSGTLTEIMRAEVAANRKRALPSDWAEVRKGKTGLTAKMMDERAQG